MLRRAPGTWLAPFAASAACWWVFEWLNRFVRNWHYLTMDDVGALEYFLHATACFAILLPAVAAVAEWVIGDHWQSGSGRPLAAPRTAGQFRM